MQGIEMWFSGEAGLTDKMIPCTSSITIMLGVYYSQFTPPLQWIFTCWSMVCLPAATASNERTSVEKIRHLSNSRATHPEASSRHSAGWAYRLVQ